MNRGGYGGVDSDPVDVGAALSVIREARAFEDEPEVESESGFESEGSDSSNHSSEVKPTSFHLPPPPTGKYLTSTLLTNAISLYGHSPQDIYESIFSPETIESDLTNALESLTTDYVEFVIGISRTGSIGLNPRGTLGFNVRDFYRVFAINVKAMTPSGPFDVGGPGGRFNGRIDSDSDEFVASFKSEYCSKRAMFSGIGMGIGMLRRVYSLCYTGGGGNGLMVRCEGREGELSV